MILNTNYKISDITLNQFCATISKLGFEVAFDISLERAIRDIRENPNSIIITESLSWSYHLSRQAADSTNLESKRKYADAAIFFRKLAHHVYWVAEREHLVCRNPIFIQAVK
jgi:hypothetical protein